MDWLNHLAQAAAVVLLGELLVGLFVFLGISGGLAFGLRWANGKTGPVFEKLNDFVPIAVGFLHRGTDFAAKPFIAGNSLAARVSGTLQALQAYVRETRSNPDQLHTVATRPVPSETLAMETAEIEPVDLT